MNPARILLASSACILIAAAAGLCLPEWVEDAVRDAADITVPEEATAIVLHKAVDVEISGSGKARTKIRYVHRILTRGGQEFGALAQPVYPFIKAKDLKGWVIKPDGSDKKLAKDEIVTVGRQESAGYYDDSQLLIARPSHIEPGDIVAFEMEIEEKGWTSFHQSFTFQIQQPVRFARFSLKVPQGWRVIHGTWRAQSIEFEQQDSHYSWTASDLEYQPEEPLAPSWYFLSRRISVACFDPEKQGTTNFANWPSVAEWCADVFREPSLFTEDITAKSREVVQGMVTFEDKVKTVAEFIQHEIRYVAVEIGKHRWRPRPASTTLFNRYGDCKDKSVLMVGMLEAVGIHSTPVLCNAVYPVDPRVPTPFQFNHCLVAVAIQDEDLPPAFENAVVGNWLFFDPTDQSTLIGQLPWNLQGDRVLLGGVADSALFELPYPDPEDYRRVYSAAAVLNEDGFFSARVKITDLGGSAASSRYIRRVTPEKDQIADWTGTMSKAVPFVEISDYQTGDAEDSVWVSFSMHGKHYVQETGGLSLLRPDIFHAPSPPALTAKERRFPVWFGPPKEIVSEIDWDLPEGWTADVDTAATWHTCGGASISSKMTINGSELSIITTYRQDGHLIWPDDYEAARNFSSNTSQVRGQVGMIRK